MPDQSGVIDALQHPAVGLGCATLGGTISVAESVRVIAAAVEGGVRHLDVARSYGYGAAEAAVGEFLKTRDAAGLRIATKVGISPPGRLHQFAALRQLARRAAALSPALRTRIAQVASAGLHPGRFGVEDMAASLHQSLRALRVDRVDLLLLHNCVREDVNDEVLDWLHQQVGSGDVGAWGVSTRIEHTGAITAAVNVPVLQIESKPTVPVSAELVRGASALIRHSVMRKTLEPLRRLLADPVARARWEEVLARPLGQKDLPGLLLSGALSLAPQGVVLAGTHSVEHAAALGSIRQLPESQVPLLAQLVSAAHHPIAV